MATFQERIRGVRSGLSPSYTRLADFLLDSYVEAVFLTATELAHTLDIDPATVVRFAQRIGYPGYPELQREIRQRVTDEWFRPPPLEAAQADSPGQAALAELAHALDLTRRGFPLRQVDQLIEALDQCERVLLLADGSARYCAFALAARLEASGYAVRVADGSVAELAGAVASGRRKELALALEATADTPYIERALQQAKRRGMRTAALVAAPSCPAARSADIVLAAHASPAVDIRQASLEALVFAVLRALKAARPGRFDAAPERVAQLIQQLAGEPPGRG
jgi:DNA-binding MurR/RpiR family transcriptional regulator